MKVVDIWVGYPTQLKLDQKVILWGTYTQNINDCFVRKSNIAQTSISSLPRHTRAVFSTFSQISTMIGHTPPISSVQHLLYRKIYRNRRETRVFIGVRRNHAWILSPSSLFHSLALSLSLFPELSLSNSQALFLSFLLSFFLSFSFFLLLSVSLFLLSYTSLNLRLPKFQGLGQKVLSNLTFGEKNDPMWSTH